VILNCHLLEILLDSHHPNLLLLNCHPQIVSPKLLNLKEEITLVISATLEISMIFLISETTQVQIPAKEEDFQTLEVTLNKSRIILIFLEILISQLLLQINLTNLINGIKIKQASLKITLIFFK